LLADDYVVQLPGHRFVVAGLEVCCRLAGVMASFLPIGGCGGEDPGNRRGVSADGSVEAMLVEAMLSRATDVIALSHRQSGRLLEVSDSFCTLLGYSREELIGRTSLEVGLIAKGSRETLLGAIADANWGLQEIHLIRRDGTQCVVESTVELLGDGELMLTMSRDMTERRAAELELKLRAELLDLAHDAVVVRGPVESRITFWNREAEVVYGYTREEATGRVSHDLLATVFPESQAAVEEALERDGHWQGILRHTRRDGAVIEVSSRQAVQRDAEDRPIAIIELNSDITQRRRAESRVRQLMDSAPDAMVAVSRDGRIVQVNPQTERTFGYQGGELIGELVEMLVPERFRGAHPGYFADPSERSMGGVRSLYGRRRDGSEFPAEISLSSIDTEDGPLAAATIRDDTSRRLAAIVESSEDAIITKDLHGTIASWNAGAQRLYGYTVADVHGKSISILVPEDHDDELAGILARVAQGESIRDFDTVRVRSDGSLVDVSLAISVVRDRSGQVIGASTIARDISERKRAEAELARARADIDQFFAVSADMMGIANAEGRFVRVNPAFERTLGFTPQELMAKPFMEFLHPDDQAAARERVAALARNRGVRDVETRCRCRDGSYRWLLWTRMVNQDGTVFATGRDVTERRAAGLELELRAGLLDLAHDAVVVREPSESRITFWNREAEAVYGYTRAEATGRVSHDLLATVFPESQQVVDEALARDGQWKGVLSHTRKDGRVIEVSSRQAVQRDADGWPIAIIELNSDITERRQMDRELRASREQALQASRLKSEFLANMSHEIRTPLNGVVCMSELMLDTELDHEQREYAEVTMTSAEALMTVISDILDFSKITAGKVDMLHETYSLETVVDDVCAIAGLRAAEKDVELAVSIGADVPPAVVGDGSRMRQVLVNLLGNAVKFTAQGEIVVRVVLQADEDATERLRVEVSDSGIGIEPDKLPDLFQSFSQADATTTRKYGGTGLGLSIAKQLVELMGGEIGAYSTPGVGSTFWFTLPCVRGTSADAAPPVMDLTGIRLLIVDGDATSRGIIARQSAGWGVIPDSADSGRAALRRLERAADLGRPFELAVIDMHMPEMDGLELARAIRANPRLRSTRLIMLSSAPVRTAEARAAGIDGSLAKPVGQARLRDQLAASLKRVARPADPTPPPASKPAASRLHVLIAEDNEINQFAATQVLRNLGYVVEIAHNGREAIEMTHDKDYTMVFMDCQMPEVDGYSATTSIRQREGSHRHTPIIALTAHAMIGDREKCLASGMDDYIVKPLRRADVEHVCGRLLNSAMGSPPARRPPSGNI
jgi:PAS domain S-box-containing protein